MGYVHSMPVICSCLFISCIYKHSIIVRARYEWYHNRYKQEYSEYCIKISHDVVYMSIRRIDLASSHIRYDNNDNNHIVFITNRYTNSEHTKGGTATSASSVVVDRK